MANTDTMSIGSVTMDNQIVNNNEQVLIWYDALKLTITQISLCIMIALLGYNIGTLYNNERNIDWHYPLILFSTRIIQFASIIICFTYNNNNNNDINFNKTFIKVDVGYLLVTYISALLNYFTNNKNIALMNAILVEIITSTILFGSSIIYIIIWIRHNL